MKKILTIVAGLIITAIIFYSCREEYNPPAITTDYNLLVVEGDIITNQDSSYFRISRTQKPGGNTGTPAKQEINASITVMSSANTELARSADLGSGRYSIANAALAGQTGFTVHITTAAGGRYVSEPITPKQTPAIGDLTWEFNPGSTGIQFYVNTNDPSGNSRYYRWEYQEVWEYRSYFRSGYEYLNGQVVPRQPSHQINSCWNTVSSSNIIIATSSAYETDFISRQPVYLAMAGTNRFNVRYSLQVRQFTLSREGYGYWQGLQKMTEQGGSIFDAQPTELIGNIRSVDNPSEPVIGFISSSTLETKRLFVNNSEVPANFFTQFPVRCDTLVPVSADPEDIEEVFGPGSIVPVGPGIPDGWEGAGRECADCTFFGGSNVKPTYW